MYTLLICADVYGEKINLEVTFPHMPTIGDLSRRVTEIFNAEAALKRPEGYPVVNFAISKLQIYDDVMLKWTDLVTCSQLHEYDQLYAFQPQSPWHSDIQKDLPPPRPPTIVQRVHTVSYQQQQSGVATDYSTPYRAGASPSYGTGVNASQQSFRGSPTQQRLEEQRRKEEALRQELRRIHEETERLEAQAQREREEEARRQQEEAERAMRQKEEDIRAQREALQRAEEELIRMQSGAASSTTPQRNLYR